MARKCNFRERLNAPYVGHLISGLKGLRKDTKMAPNATRSRRGGQRGSESRANRNRAGYKSAESSDKDVPLLKFGQGNNWLVFKEKMYTACLEKYGDLARLIENEEYYILKQS